MKTAKRLLASLMSAIIMMTAISTSFTFLPSVGLTAKAVSYEKAYKNEYYYPPGTKFIEYIGVYFSSKSADKAKNGVRNGGYTLIDTDCNSGGGGYYIYMGYKTTTDITRALRSVRFTHKTRNDVNSISSAVNGTKCTYWIIGKDHEGTANDMTDPSALMDGAVDLNEDAKGSYIYTYASRDYNAGAPITSVSIDSETSASGCETSKWIEDPTTLAELNEGTKKHNRDLYFHYSCVPVDSSALRDAMDKARLVIDNRAGYVSVSAVRTALGNAEPCIEALDKYAASTYTQANIDSYTAAINNALNALQTKISLDANGGTISGAATTSANVTIGLKTSVAMDVSPYVPVRTGYTFLGWADNKNAVNGSKSTINVTFSQTIYAAWKAGTYTVSFDANGGTCPDSSKSVTYDSAYGTLPIPTRTGYGFEGWFTSAQGGSAVDADTVMSTASNHTLYAHWSANAYTVSFDANGGTCPDSSKSVTYDSAYGTLPIPTRTGYGFEGWFTSAQGGSAVDADTVMSTASNHTLYAHWSANAYTVSFDANGGTCSDSSKSVAYDSAYGELPVPTKDCYNFEGWFTAKDGGTQVKADTKVLTDSNHTLYAHWALNEHDYKKSYVVEPTCTERGYTVYICLRCNAVMYGDYTPVDENAHDWHIVSSDETTHTYQCSFCLNTKTEAHKKDMDGKCICGSEFSDGAYTVDILLNGQTVCFKYMQLGKQFDSSTFSVPVKYRTPEYRVGHKTVLTPKGDYGVAENGDVQQYDASFVLTDYASQKFTVTTVDGSNKTSAQYSWEQKATAKATGTGFLYWKDEYGNVVSTYKTYYFLAVKDTTLTAVYSNAETQSKAFIKTNFAEKGDDGSLTFYSERCVNYKSYKILSHGILLAPSSAVGNDYNTLYNSLICSGGNSKVLVYDKPVAEGQTKSKCYGLFTVAIPESYLTANGLGGELWYARAYVLVETADGKLEYHYGDIGEYDLSQEKAQFVRRTDVKNDNLLVQSAD